LALSSVELQALIQREADENPAIEMEELPVCQQCGRPIQNGICVHCITITKQDTQQAVTEVGDYADDGVWQRRTTGGSDDEEFDPTTRIAAQMSLQEHLTLTLQAQFPLEDAPIIEFLVGNLDEDGRLRCSNEEVEDLFEVIPEH